MIRVTWVDLGKEPQCPPNPAFPQGVDIDLTNGKQYFCQVPLPYPAKRIGHYLLHCDLCGQRVVITTAGRPDDPRSAKLACQHNGRPANRADRRVERRRAH